MQASSTARYMAFFRALESGRPPGQRLFADPLAKEVLNGPLRMVASVARVRPIGTAIARYVDRRWPGARPSGIARTRVIDDYLRDALVAGAEQIVILGAGFDSRAYRMPELESRRVFEVDQPATQAAKRDVVNRALGNLPAHVTYVAVDFNRDALSDALSKAGFDNGKRAFVVWEGVTGYLSADGVDATLAWVAQATPGGSRLCFTYLHRGVIDGSVDFYGAKAVKAKVESEGEPWTFGLAPAEVPGYLEARGLRLLEDAASTDHGERLGMPLVRGYGFYRLAVAEVV